MASSWVCTVCNVENRPEDFVCTLCGEPLPPCKDGGSCAVIAGIGVKFLTALVKSFRFDDASMPVDMEEPMKGVIESVSAFQPMSLYESLGNSGKSDQVQQGESSTDELSALSALEEWLCRCAVAAPSLRGDAVVALQRLCLATGKLSSMLNLCSTMWQLPGELTPDQASSALSFLKFLENLISESRQELLRMPFQDKWRCKYCTFLNLPHLNVCEMCAGERDSPVAPGAAATLGGDASAGSSDGQIFLPTADHLTSHRKVAVHLYSVLQRLAQCRIQASRFGDKEASEPFIVGVRQETFDMMYSQLREMMGVNSPTTNFENKNIDSNPGLVRTPSVIESEENSRVEVPGVDTNSVQLGGLLSPRVDFFQGLFLEYGHYLCFYQPI